MKKKKKKKEIFEYAVMTRFDRNQLDDNPKTRLPVTEGRSLAVCGRSYETDCSRVKTRACLVHAAARRNWRGEARYPFHFRFVILFPSARNRGGRRLRKEREPRYIYIYFRKGFLHFLKTYPRYDSFEIRWWIEIFIHIYFSSLFFFF